MNYSWLRTCVQDTVHMCGLTFLSHFAEYIRPVYNLSMVRIEDLWCLYFEQRCIHHYYIRLDLDIVCLKYIGHLTELELASRIAWCNHTQ